MATKKTYVANFRRRREGKTNYKKRLLLVKSSLPRLVVRKSNRYLLVQVVEYKSTGDMVVCQAHSRELQKFGWNAGKKNLPAAYLTGLLAGLRCKKAGKPGAILDIGFNTPVHGSACFAALKGAVDAGLQVKFDAAAIPSEGRIQGKHIAEHAKLLGKNAGKIFSGYAKEKINISGLDELFKAAKEKIIASGVKK